MNWGECDSSPIKKLRDKFQNIIQTKMIDSFIKELLEDGDISERDRRTLERLRKSLDISEERANQLESLV